MSNHPNCAAFGCGWQESMHKCYYPDCSVNRPLSETAQLRSEPGLRYDAGKPRIDLLPPEALLRWGEVAAMGAEKYAERNWEKGMSYGRILAAAFRHLLRRMMGEINDPESGLPHLAHALWNVGALLTFDERKMTQFDDLGRPQ